MNLADYLRSNGLSAASFGSRIGIENRATIWRYVKGSRFPTPAVLARIHDATGGKVTASDFVEQHRASNPELYPDAVVRPEGEVVR